MAGSILLPNPASPAHVIVRIHGAWTDSRIPAIAAQLHRDDPDLLLVAREYKKTSFIESYDLYCRGQFLSSWKPTEVERILSDVALMRAGAEGRATPVSQRIRKANAQREEAAWSVWRENYHQALERFAEEAATAEDGKRFFGQVGGRKDD